MSLVDYAKKFGVVYLVGVMLIGCGENGNRENSSQTSNRNKSGESVPLVPQKVQLWKNGLYWADRNIGAKKPWETGYYFGWGDTIGYTRKGNVWVASDGSLSNFSFEEKNTPINDKDLSYLRREGWTTSDNVLTPEHDAAHVQWGGKWRMPTDKDLGDLIEKCEWIWMTTNGVKGYVVRGRGDYASASIFLPCAGGGNGTSLVNFDSSGYWLSVTSSDHIYYPWFLYLKPDYYCPLITCRYFGFPVRPVHER